jgi:hypothetical protein
MPSRASRRPKPIPISVARGRIFELIESVLTGRADRVALSHKGHAEPVVLVRAEELARLEAELAALRERVGSAPRPLRGLGSLHVPADEVLLRSRATAAALAAEKRARLRATPGTRAAS